MREATIVLSVVAVFLGGVASADSSYVNSRGTMVELTPAPDRIAVVPTDGWLVEQMLAARDDIHLDGSVVRHASGLWDIPLAEAWRGSGGQVARQLLAEGLVQRIGAVFVVPGSDKRFMLDQGVMVRLHQSVSGLPKKLLQPTGLAPLLQLDREGKLFLCQAEDALSGLDGSRLASKIPEVVWALPDFIVPIELYLTPNDTYYDEQWYHDQANGAHINSEEAWDVTLGDNQVVVAVIDTGLDANHPDFAGTNVVQGYDVPGNDNDPTPPSDAINAHGTCCSGEVAGTINNNEGMAGTCPGCSLMGIRMMDGWAQVAELSGAYVAITWAADNGAWVLSNSWGIDSSLFGQIDMQPFYDAVLDAVNNGRGGLGSVVLFASGNDGASIATGELADMSEIMAIGGTDDNDSWVSYSNYGSNLSVVAPTGGSGAGDPQILTTDTIGSRGFSRNGEYYAPWIPGIDLPTGQPEPDSTGNYTRYFNGTSASCPIAAGVVGLVFSANPALTGPEARFVVEQTADKVGGVNYGSDGHHNNYGYGRVNAGRAVRAAEIGFNNPDGAVCAENFNCSNDDCQKDQPDDFYGYCGGQLDCSTLPDGSPCDDDNPCTENDACSSGTCTGTSVDCSDGNVCTDDTCNPANGQCVYTDNNDPCDDGILCTENDSCSGGSCAGTVIDCADTNPCTDDSCNPANGECVHTNNSDPCDDGDFCTTNDTCSGGSCASTPVDCSDGNVCTDDSCNPANGECVYADNNDSCDDNNPCTENDTCSGGSCAGTVIDCADTNPCTDDSCNPANGQCVYTNNNDSCDDGSLCTEIDTCSGGSCAGTAVDCSDGNVCTDDSCNPASGECEHTDNAASCDDGDACTENDTCSGGSCSGLAITCSDSNVCTDDSCDPATGCVFTNNSASCDDGDVCTENDACAGGSCSGSAVSCDDGNVCTDDSCEADAGCVFANNTNSCDDGNACTMEDTCANSICAGVPLDADGDGHVAEACGGDDCDDGQPGVHGGVFEGPFGDATCTDGVDNDCDDLTDENDNGCVQCVVDADCADQNLCNGDETCAAGQCQQGTDLICDDGNVCTDDGCDPASGCTATPNAVACDDGDLCTENDACSGGTCGGTPLDCDDGDVCTEDACDSLTGDCAHTASTCDDDNPCTDDSCDPVQGCVHANREGACDDGDPCTENDACVQGACAGSQKDCSSLDSACVQGVCNATNGSCEEQAVADGTACEDGDDCTEGDTCQAGVCASGEDTCGSDGCSCTVASKRSAPASVLFFLILGLMLGSRSKNRRRF